MRRFFFFRSSASDSTSSNRTSTAPLSSSNGSSFWEASSQNDGKNPVVEKIQDGSQMPKDSAFKPVNRDPESAIPSCSHHRRRSPSFSSENHRENTYPSSNLSGSSSSCGSSHSNPQTRKNCTRPKRGGEAAAQHLHAVGELDSPFSSRDRLHSSGDSPHSSPIPPTCRCTRRAPVLDKNKNLNPYIDGKHHDIKSQKVSQNQSRDTEQYCSLEENSGRPQQAWSTAPSSPTCSKEDLRTYSLSDDLGLASPRRHANKTREIPMHAMLEKSMMKSRELDSEAFSTIEDAHEDSSEPLPTLNSNDIGLSANLNRCCTKELSGFQRQHSFLRNGLMDTKNDKFPISDEKLVVKVEEVEQMIRLLSDEELQNCSFNVPALLQTIRNISEDRKNLAVELLSQKKFRLAERSSAKERLKRAKLELDIRTRRMVKEKNELRSSLEKEMDRRYSDWAMRHEKLQCEEQRLRERVRGLAEKNVSLQREIFSVKGLEMDNTRSRILNSGVEASLEKARTENHDLRHSLSELQEKLKGAEEERECIRRSYKEKERENKELQKVVAWLRRVCSEQDKTINGLRQDFHDEIREQSVERSDPVSRLQMEQLRLTGVEQNLRKEVESLRHEVESLRHEHMGLLNRLQATGNGGSFSAIKLEQELCDQVDFFQDKGLSLLHDLDRFSGNLLDLISRKKCEHDQGPGNEFDGCSFADYTMKYQSLHRGHENFRRSLRTTAEILAKKSSSQALDCQSETTERGRSKHSEDELEHELKAETLLKRVLQEKLFSKELELDQLRADLASSIRVHDVLQTEIQRLQDELSCLTHKMKDMELQMLKKDESIKHLQHDLQEDTKELTATRNILLKTSQERDHMWEEVKHSRETVMLLNHEVLSLKKKIEELDEEVLIKEGQIAILKDNLSEKPFDIICSPRTVKEFFQEIK